MLFNSYPFLLLFFPVAIGAFLLLRRWRVLVLAVASAVFYACWDVRFLALLGGSILVNFGFGLAVQRAVRAGRGRWADGLVGGAVGANLLVLGVFKYARFAAETLEAVSGIGVGAILLPLGISFFTFEQIGFLVDLRRGAAYRLDLLRYAVFVSFFPRLVAGPILRFNEIVPQLGRAVRADDVAMGLSIFAIGLAKKAFLADGVAVYVGPAFLAAGQGEAPDLLAAWAAALAFTCQLYFDFSGYSDMAIGAARCFGVRFPENFDSPYKAGSIIEFWRRWHMTLSRFLRDYLYIPLGGNRLGEKRRMGNLLLTMVLGGLWHGASWTFVVWGGLHGVYLVANHLWRGMAGRWAVRTTPAGRAAGFVLTFLAVVVAWVLFRATTLSGAMVMLGAMVGRHGVAVPDAVLGRLPALGPVFAAVGVRGGGSGSQFLGVWLWVAGLLAVEWAAPNTREIVARAEAVLARGPGRAWAVAAGVTAVVGFLCVRRASPFLYWQF